jgi:hypothetical protein
MSRTKATLSFTWSAVRRTTVRRHCEPYGIDLPDGRRTARFPSSHIKQRHERREADDDQRPEDRAPK